ncbi:nuclease-related domain-containing protein [Cytobacillus purgationiresistens]|uniref:NERD domain-containing protein n=1 Tax=Cytobacillus purgationiresistens TaxID=863449 RepID=A0ABU0ARV7_9BACI|nr:nuclease-related domain-containing protein [Cytobacillus purgationiresistens]MDQ0273604.1 hypothetical protein [Cytobacillus purgationiresistens]
MRQLDRRKGLTAMQQQYYLNLEKGFEGERFFKEYLQSITNEVIILQDLLLELNQTTFQLDLLCIMQQKLYLFEVKIYEDNYFIDKDIWYTLAGKEIKNALNQLKRSESLLRQLRSTLNKNTFID